MNYYGVRTRSMRKIVPPSSTIARERIERLGVKMVDLWPQDEELQQYQTSVSTAEIVDAHYRASLPDGPIKLLLLSESPCHTRDDLAKMMSDLGMLEAAGIKLDKELRYHVNLVHCFSYGESWMIDKSTIEESTEDKKKQYSRGTLAFWKILATMAGKTDVQENGSDPLESYESIDTAYDDLKDQAERLKRLQYKIEILKDLKKMGIALIDVSPFAIYFGSGSVTRYNKETNKPYFTPAYALPADDYNKIIRAAFETYSGPFLQDIKPERVVVLGKKVEKALRRKDMLQNVVDSFDGILLKPLVHPSSCSFWGDNAASSLQALRKLSLIARGEAPLPDELVIQRKKAKKRKKPSAPKKPKKNTKKPAALVTPDKETVAPMIVDTVSEPSMKKARKSRSSNKATMKENVTPIVNAEAKPPLRRKKGRKSYKSQRVTKKNAGPIANAVSAPPRKTGRQSRTSQKAMVAPRALYDNEKWTSFLEW